MAIRNELILLPLLAQVLLTILVYVALAVAKSRAVKRGQVDPERRALHADAWPESVQKINNNIRNQFEVPSKRGIVRMGEGMRPAPFERLHVRPVACGDGDRLGMGDMDESAANGWAMRPAPPMRRRTFGKLSPFTPRPRQRRQR